MSGLRRGYVCKSATIFIMLFIDIVINGLMDMINHRYVYVLLDEQPRL